MRDAFSSVLSPIQLVVTRAAQPFEYAVKRDNIRVFAEAIGDDNPAYFADDPAEVVLPPTFPTAFLLKGAGDMVWNQLEGIGVDLLRLLHSEQEYEYLGSIASGDTVHGQTTVADVYTKPMRAFTLEFVVTETEYTNQHGDKVLREVLTLIVRHEASE